MTELDQFEWAQKAAESENAIILDVRTEGEWSEGIIPGAKKMNILDSAAFIKGLDDLDKTVPYYVYCRSGGRSAQACMLMNSKGITETYNLLGGISEWDGEIER